MNRQNLNTGLLLGVGYRKNKLMTEIGYEVIRWNVNSAYIRG